MTATTQAFGEAAATWQNFYLLVGGAAATLIGLMFVAVTFGSSLVTPETSAVARSFLDPTFAHFVQLLFTACLVTIPTMGPTVLGVILVGMAALRILSLGRTTRHLRQAHRHSGDIELSDWMTGAIVPLLAYLLLGAAGVGFMGGSSLAFTGLVVVTLAILLNGLIGAWELMVWMAVARNRPKTAGDTSAG